MSIIKRAAEELVGEDYSRIRILFLVDGIYSTRGGTEQHLYWLLNKLPDNNFKKFFFILSTVHNCDITRWPIPGLILSDRHGSGPMNWVRRVAAVRQMIRQHRIDIVHTLCPMSELVGVCASDLGRTAKVVGSRRNIGYGLDQKGAWRSRFVSRFVWQYIANSEAAKLKSIARERIPIGKIEVIPNPVVESRISEGRNNLGCRRELAADDELIVAMVATVRPIKDYATFIRAARIVADRRPKVCFVSIGEADDGYTGIRDLAVQLGLASKFVWLGGIDNPFSLLPFVDVAVLSSLSESFSNAVLEYAAAGLPAVVTDVGALREIVIDNETGYVVPPASPEVLADKILELVDNPVRRQQFGARAREHVVQRFSEASVLSKYIGLYRRHYASSMIYLLVGYMWLFVHRPFEVWPWLEELRVERVYMLMTLAYWTTQPKTWTANRLNFGVACLAASITLSTLLGPLGSFESNEVQNWFKLLLFWFLVMTSTRSVSDLKMLVAGFVVIMGLYELHSLREYLNGRGVYRMGTWRMVGVDNSLGDPNSFAASVIYGIPMLLPAVALASKRWQQWAIGGLLMLSVTCILLTGSRGGFVALLVTFSALGMASKYRWRMLALMVLASILLSFNLSDNLRNRYLTLIDPSRGPANAQVSAESREVFFSMAVDIWQEHPVFGVGPEGFGSESGTGMQSHSLYAKTICGIGHGGRDCCVCVSGWIFHKLPDSLPALQGFSPDCGHSVLLLNRLRHQPRRPAIADSRARWTQPISIHLAVVCGFLRARAAILAGAHPIGRRSVN